jgi:hypothetical protein
MVDRPPPRRSEWAQPRTAARQLQNIRLGSASADPLSKSRNQRADGDGCVEFAPDAGSRTAEGCDGWTVGDGHWARLERSRPETVAPVDRRAFDAADNALRQRISPRSGDLRSRLKRQALAVRIEWSTGTRTNPTPPPCWTGRGSFRRARDPLKKYGFPQNRGLTVLKRLTAAPLRGPARFVVDQCSV